MEHPGKVLEAKLKENEMTRKELSLRTGVTEKHISTVINGSRGISVGFARKLGYVFPTSSDWLKLQSEFDEEQLRIQEENSISAEEIALLKPLNDITTYFVEKKYMHNNCGEASKVMQLRMLLNVSDLTSIPKITYNAAYRAQVSSNAKVDPYVLFAWQRLCEKETENINVSNSIDKEKLKKNLNNIKKLMHGDINDGIAKLQALLSDCGIAFQVVKNFRGAPVQGFIKESSNKKLILCLTIRRKRADTFWFTLFHEIAHILYSDYSTRFVDFDSVQSEMEERADQFARDALINAKKYHDFVFAKNEYSWDDIEAFAEAENVEPFIVLGRLQKDGYLDWSDYTNKIVHYAWAE